MHRYVCICIFIYIYASVLLLSFSTWWSWRFSNFCLAKVPLVLWKLLSLWFLCSKREDSMEGVGSKQLGTSMEGILLDFGEKKTVNCGQNGYFPQSLARSIFNWLLDHFWSICFAFWVKVNIGRKLRPSDKYIFAIFVEDHRPFNKAISMDPVAWNKAVAPPLRRE